MPYSAVRSLLSDPRLFNYAVMALFACAAIRWAFARQWLDALYWSASVALTVAFTFK